MHTCTMFAQGINPSKVFESFKEFQCLTQQYKLIKEMLTGKETNVSCNFCLSPLWESLKRIKNLANHVGNLIQKVMLTIEWVEIVAIQEKKLCF